MTDHSHLDTGTATLLLHCPDMYETFTFNDKNWGPQLFTRLKFEAAVAAVSEGFCPCDSYVHGPEQHQLNERGYCGPAGCGCSWTITGAENA